MRKSYSWTPVNDISFNHIGGEVNLSKCSDPYRVSDALRQLGIEVKYI